MSKSVMAVQGLDGFVRIALSEGVTLKLTQREFVMAMARSKAECRLFTQAERETQGQAMREAAKLDWIADGQ